MAVKFLDLTGLQKFWTKCKNAFVAKDSSGNVTVSGSLSVNGNSNDDEVNILTSGGLKVANDITTNSNVIVKDGAVVVTAQDETTLCSLTCSSDGKLLSNEIALATVNDVSSAVANAGHLKREKVSSLPNVATAKENVIYMLPISGASGEDTFDEYMLIDGKLEKMGSSRIDLTGYSTTVQMNTAISTAISNAHTAITETEINNLT